SASRRRQIDCRTNAGLNRNCTVTARFCAEAHGVSTRGRSQGVLVERAGKCAAGLMEHSPLCAEKPRLESLAGNTLRCGAFASRQSFEIGHGESLPKVRLQFSE